MSVELDEEIEKLITDEVQNGRSGSAKEFISRAVKHFVMARELGEEYTRAEIDEKITRGIASLERGEGADGEHFLGILEAELDAAYKAH
jgi:Arc/MetJ-type ribon-helix-helix transcriptional regulator